MSIFDDNEPIALTDEALYGESGVEAEAEAETGGEAEGEQTVGTSEEEPATEAETEQTEGEEAPEAEEQPASDDSETGAEETEGSEAESEQTISSERYNEAIRDLQTQSIIIKQMEARIAELQAATGQAQTAFNAPPQQQPLQKLTEEDKAKFIEKFVANPFEAISPFIEQAVNQRIQPIVAERNKQIGQKVFSDAMDEAMRDWPQLRGDKPNEAFTQAFLMATQGMSEAELHKHAPALVHYAARQAFGMPKNTDQTAIDAAIAQGRKQALAEMKARSEGKQGLSAVTTPNKTTDREPTPEEKLLLDLRAKASGGGLFG